MPECSFRFCTDTETYQASLQDILQLLVLKPRSFHALLSWANLVNLNLLRAQESSARVGYMALPSDSVFVTFPTQRDSVLLYGGTTLQQGDIMFHARGERLHQRTIGACNWASIAVTPTSLTMYGRALAGRDLVAPPTGQIIRPPRADGRQLLRLHAQFGRLVETNPDRIANVEVVRALEQELISAMIGCLSYGAVREVAAVSQRNSEILRLLEMELAAQTPRLLRSQDICRAIGISQEALRASCSAVLGMGPGRYQRLRRLKLLRAELLRVKPATARGIEEAAKRYGFPNLHHFVAEYWRLYGEMPPIPSHSLADQ